MNHQILLQEYLVTAMLCNHRSTIVYLARHIRLQYLCVIKRYGKESGQHLQGMMEAELLRACQHSGIPRVYQTCEDEQYYFLIEEYMEGSTLHTMCQSEALTFRETLSFGIQLCNIVLYLHSLSKPILHLDINPTNLIVNKNHLALIDFGASIFMNQREYTGSRYGTIGYAAPEQSNDKPMDMRTDIFAIGSTMESILYSLSRNAPDTRRFQKEIHSMQSIICRCMRAKKWRRYSHVEKVRKQFIKIYRGIELEKGEERELYIAVAGAESHIGTTHTSLLLCSYLQRHHIPCIYVEYNPTKAAKQLIAEGVFSPKDGTYRYEGVPIYPDARDGIVKQWLDGIQVIVLDYGVLSSENCAGFELQDLRLIVHGCKPYELDSLSQSLDYLSDFQKTFFLGNFQSAKRGKTYIDYVPRENQRRLPYEPELSNMKHEETDCMFQSILSSYLPVRRKRKNEA